LHYSTRFLEKDKKRTANRLLISTMAQARDTLHSPAAGKGTGQGHLALTCCWYRHRPGTPCTHLLLVQAQARDTLHSPAAGTGTGQGHLALTCC